MKTFSRWGLNFSGGGIDREMVDRNISVAAYRV